MKPTTEILRLCDEVIAASEGVMPLTLIENPRTEFMGMDDVARYVAIACNTSAALAEHLKQLHAALAAAGVDVDALKRRSK